MAQKSNEHGLQNAVRNQLAGPAKLGKIKTFRANVGTGWQSNDIVKPSKSMAVVVNRGDLILRNARPFSTGLPPGFSDTFGWEEVVITPEMVGMTIAQFWALELKDQAKVSELQQNFIEAVKNGGGKAGAPRSEQEACDILGVPYEPLTNRRSR